MQAVQLLWKTVCYFLIKSNAHDMTYNPSLRHLPQRNKNLWLHKMNIYTNSIHNHQRGNNSYVLQWVNGQTNLDYSATKKKELLISGTAYMNLIGIMLSERSSLKDYRHVTLYDILKKTKL